MLGLLMMYGSGGVVFFLCVGLSVMLGGMVAGLLF